MNEHLELEKIGLGSKNSQPLPSKSLLTTINTGFKIQKKKEDEEKPITIIELPKQDVIVPPLEIKEIEVIELPKKKEIPLYQDDSIRTTIETGFIQNKTQPIVPCKKELKCKPHKNEDSVIETVDTGFDCTNTIVRDCPKPKYKTHLCKENYLSEFKTESEKQLARTNLGVYSKEEINNIVANIVENNTKEFVTKKEVENMINDLDFVNSTLRSYVNYEIPDDLFKL